MAGESDQKEMNTESDEIPAENLEDLSRMIKEKASGQHRLTLFNDWELMENLRFTNALYGRSLPGKPASERPFFGPIFRFIKRIIVRLLGWYINPIVENQRDFNAYATRTLNEIKRYLDHLQINEDIIGTIVNRDLALFRANIIFMNKYLEKRMGQFESEIARIRREGAPESELVSGDGSRGKKELADSIDVLALCMRLQGSPRAQKERQKAYLNYFKGCKDVVHVGCGRGEFLQLLSSQGIRATGSETNQTLVEYCSDCELDVVLSDPIDFLDSLEDSSLDGILLSKFAGRKSPAQLVRMLEICKRKLKTGSPLVIETPNPFSVFAIASYAIEESEFLHPLHPETLKLICTTYGFKEPQVVFLNPLPPEENLEELDLKTTGAFLDPREIELFNTVNENFSKINRLLFSHADYALVAKRA